MRCANMLIVNKFRLAEAALSGVSLLAGLGLCVAAAQAQQAAPTREEIIDALAPPPQVEITRSMRARGLHSNTPPKAGDLPSSAPAATPAAAEAPPKPKAIETTEITFKSGSDELTPEARAVLEAKYAPALAVVNAQYAEVRTRSMSSGSEAPAAQIIWVAGHTDDRGSHDYNDDLSAKRANATVTFLQNSLRAKGDNRTEVRLLPKGCGKRYLKVARSGDVTENRRVVIRRDQASVEPCTT
jgi:outer membrane protein OmpA-like peptidoglycan-associated protein